jgi:hypothetical protein
VKRKFVIGGHNPFDAHIMREAPMLNYWLVIEDVSYFIAYEKEINKWCKNSLTDYVQKGMILGFINDEERTLFLLRWG